MERLDAFRKILLNLTAASFLKIVFAIGWFSGFLSAYLVLRIFSQFKVGILDPDGGTDGTYIAGDTVRWFLERLLS